MQTNEEEEKKQRTRNIYSVSIFLVLFTNIIYNNSRMFYFLFSLALSPIPFIFEVIKNCYCNKNQNVFVAVLKYIFPQKVNSTRYKNERKNCATIKKEEEGNKTKI